MRTQLLSLVFVAVKESASTTADRFGVALRRGSIEATIWERLGFYLALAVTLVVSLFPIYVMVVTSISPDFELYNPPPTLVPPIGAITVEHYVSIFDPETFPFVQYFVNSIIVSVITSGLAVVVATFGGYSFARLDYRGRSAVKKLVLFVYLFGGILLVVPLFKIVVFLGMVDTLSSLMITYLVFVLPLSLYMLGNYFEGIPEEIEEAALIDGYSRIETIFRVTLPLSMPGIVAVFLFAFVVAWNEFLFASIFLKSTANFTLPIGIVHLSLTFRQAWGQIMAASLATSVPIVVIFLYLEKYMIEGLTHGGVEG
jgi:multiple sugar transport system permease protein